MRVSVIAIAASACLCLATLNAQAQPAPTLQLPTFSFATVTTTVMVPDQGSTFLGGISRAADGRNEYGVPGLSLPGFQNRAIGMDRSTSSFRVSVTIHDFDAMDQALLGTPSPNGLARNYPPQRPCLPEMPAAIAAQPSPEKAAKLAGNWRVVPIAPAPVSDPATEEAGRAARQAARADEADGYFARAKQAEADGKPHVAKIYYQMAVRRASGELKQQAQARLDAISGRTTALANSAP
jgi:hypothetical protein